METSCGFIEVDLFSKEVEDVNHPEALRFKRLLEEVAAQYKCNLTFFDVNEGTVTFSIDSDDLTAEVGGLLQEKDGET